MGRSLEGWLTENHTRLHAGPHTFGKGRLPIVSGLSSGCGTSYGKAGGESIRGTVTYGRPSS